MKYLLSLALAFVSLPGLFAEPVNKKCPISGEDVDTSIVSNYTRVVGFCCENCQGKFNEAPYPALAKAALPADKVVNTACPHSGKPVKADQVASVNGVTIAFCCARCKAKGEEKPEATLKLLEATKPANDKCPVSGKDVDTSVYTKVSVEVAFCCEKCQSKFDADPNAAIGNVE